LKIEKWKADGGPPDVVAEVPAGPSKRGWNDPPSVLKRMVGEVMFTGPPHVSGTGKRNPSTPIPDAGFPGRFRLRPANQAPVSFRLRRPFRRAVQNPLHDAEWDGWGYP